MIFLLILVRHKVNRGTVTLKEKEVISTWWAFHASFIAILNYLSSLAHHISGDLLGFWFKTIVEDYVNYSKWSTMKKLLNR